MMNPKNSSWAITLAPQDNSRDDELLDDNGCPNPALEVASDVEKLGRHNCSRIVNKNKADIDDDDDDDDEEEDEELERFHKEAWLEGGIYERQARAFAEACLSYLDDKQDGGKKYELVNLGSSSATTFCGPLIHANFEAKAKDCPAAPVETFFAQLRQTRVLVVDCCVSLGPSEELPCWENADLRGCKLCGIQIHHPAENCEKLIKSQDDDVSWLYGDDYVSSSESD